MSKTRNQKEEIVKGLAKTFDESKSIVFIDPTGLTVSQVDQIKKQFRKADAKYSMAKNTLINIALKKSKFSKVKTEDLSGQNAVIFAKGDEASPARIVYEFARKNKLPKFKFGILGGEFLSSEKVKTIAKLPSKDQLLSILVGTINAPVSGFVNVLSGNIRNFVGILSAIKESKAK